jgi:hypothetical protein
VKDVERPSRCGITREFTFLTHDAFKRLKDGGAFFGIRKRQDGVRKSSARALPWCPLPQGVSAASCLRAGSKQHRGRSSAVGHHTGDNRPARGSVCPRAPLRTAGHRQLQLARRPAGLHEHRRFIWWAELEAQGSGQVRLSVPRPRKVERETGHPRRLGHGRLYLLGRAGECRHRRALDDDLPGSFE